MQNRRVGVTGIGVICALGNSVPEFWSSLLEGRSGIAPIELVDCTALRYQNGAEVRGFSGVGDFDPSREALLDRFAKFGLLAARQALREAGIEWRDSLKERTAIITGSSMGGQTTEDTAFADLYQRGRSRVNPLSIPRVMSSAVASHVSMEYGITGPAYSISTACSSSNHAIGQAFWMVRSGIADLAITGGSEAPFSLGNLKAWEAMRVVSADTCRPFSKDRSGLVLGEGAGMFVLEPLDSAVSRGARVFGEIVGFGMSADAHHITQPSPLGAARAVRAALGDGGVPPEAVGYVNAHGTATLANDPMEVTALRAVFGALTEKIAVSSTKSMHGHALGAAGALEAAATLLALYHGWIPPTANFTTADPECDIDVVPNSARRADCEYALSNSFAFGGLNAVLAFRASNR